MAFAGAHDRFDMGVRWDSVVRMNVVIYSTHASGYWC
jgi:hypothetical protein